MINVLHVSDKLSVGDATLHGVTRLFSWWIPRFDKKRFHVMACSLRRRDKAAEYLEGLGIIVYCLGRGKFDPRTIIDLVTLIKKQQIQILHLHGYGATTFGRIASSLTGIDCIVHEHMYDKGIPFYQKWADRLLSRSTLYAIAVSKSVKDFLVSYRAIRHERVKVIYNGVPLETFKESDASEVISWKTKLGIPEKNKVVCIVGRLNLIKGHRYFLEAAAYVLEKFSDATFLVVGDGELFDSLQEKSNQLDLSNNVIFMGHCDDVPSLLHKIDIKVISSLSEGVPMTLFEAMASGCPVVASDVGGIGEVIKDGETGFLVPSKDPKALSEKILLLLNNKDLQKAMAKKSRESSYQYDISTTVREFEQYYGSILSR